MIDALSLLKLRLTTAFDGVVHPEESWTDSVRTAKMTERVRRDHGGAGIPANSASITDAVESFRKSGRVDNFRDLKYVCLGVGLPDQKGWSVLGDPRLRTIVFGLAEGQTELRRRLRCFQALLSSYWTFRLNEVGQNGESKHGWEQLRTWLFAERVRLQQFAIPELPWFVALARHADLLTDEPCRKFGEALLRRDSSELDDAIKSLAIPENSWVLEETIIAQVRATIALTDDKFKAELERLLSLALGTDGVRFGESLRVRCVAHLVSRFAKCTDRSENIALRTAAVTIIGNPWLRRAKWDASVVDGKGRPDDRAREMVNSWLKRRLITDFFTLLSVDGTGDPRRLDYWLRFEPFIDDMWFALGSTARTRTSADFKEFRTSAWGRLLVLIDSDSENNAFVMRIGKYLAVEFGSTGNACFLFKWDSLWASLVDRVSSPQELREVSLSELKAPRDCETTHLCEARMIHQDSAGQSWEQKFDMRICPVIGHWPKSSARSAPAQPAHRPQPARNTQPTTVPLPPSVRGLTGVRNGPTPVQWKAFISKNRLAVEDKRAKGGAIWVRGDALSSEITSQLKSWGFRQSPRGWYKEYL